MGEWDELDRRNVAKSTQTNELVIVLVFSVNLERNDTWEFDGLDAD